MVYAAKKESEASKLDHVFKLQQSMRLSSKQTGATNTIGKQQQRPSMSVRAGAHNSFKEQRDMLMNIRDETTTKVGKYIRRDISIKVSAKVALDEHHRALHDA